MGRSMIVWGVINLGFGLLLIVHVRNVQLILCGSAHVWLGGDQLGVQPTCPECFCSLIATTVLFHPTEYLRPPPAPSVSSPRFNIIRTVT